MFSFITAIADAVGSKLPTYYQLTVTFDHQLSRYVVRAYGYHIWDGVTTYTFVLKIDSL